MEKIEIKKIGIKELNALQHIGKQTFFETFASSNSQENVQKYLTEEFTDDILTKELNNPFSHFYFATIGAAVIGYLKVNFGNAQTEMKDANAMEIERIYVLKQFQGKKVGQILYDKAIEVATLAGVSYVWLGVWEHNLRAIHFYTKNGFIAFDKHLFILGNDEQVDIMMKLTLR